MKKWASLVILLSCLVITPLWAQEGGASAPEARWQFRDIGGNRIGWGCKGAGRPTIILIAGLGLSAQDSFGHIYRDYDGPGRLCLYDRAGMGKSSFAAPRT